VKDAALARVHEGRKGVWLAGSPAKLMKISHLGHSDRRLAIGRVALEKPRIEGEAGRGSSDSRAKEFLGANGSDREGEAEALRCGQQQRGSPDTDNSTSDFGGDLGELI